MYDRTVRPIPEAPKETYLRYRIETLVGITGARMAKYRIRLKQAFWVPIKVVFRPHLLGILLFEVR